MATNPVVGTEFEQSFQEGFAAGFIQPDQEHPAPSPLTPDQQDAYAQGVQAGTSLIQKILNAPLTPPDPPESVFASLAHIAVEGVHAEHAALEVRFEEATLGAAGSTVLLTVFLSIAIFGPERLPFFDEAAAAALNLAIAQLNENGVITDNVELFMAACDRTGHASPAGPADVLTRQGWFHGRVFLRFEDALAEAKQHGHPDDTKVLRYQTAAPNSVDLIDLDALS